LIHEAPPPIGWPGSQFRYCDYEAVCELELPEPVLASAWALG
jgi:hypothetical protein